MQLSLALNKQYSILCVCVVIVYIYVIMLCESNVYLADVSTQGNKNQSAKIFISVQMFRVQKMSKNKRFM